jgi:hypothetical protein
MSGTELAKFLKKEKQASSWTLGGVPFIKNSETSHVILTGERNQGQLWALYDLLKQIQARKKVAVIYDKDGTFIERFYRPGVDTILNPFDKRSVLWNVWADCKTQADLEAVSEILMPDRGDEKDQFCNTIARALFSVTAWNMLEKQETSSVQLLDYVFNANIDQIKAVITYTAPNIIFEASKIELIARRVKVILCEQLECLRSFEGAEKPFSIHHWAQHNPKNGCLFLCPKNDDDEHVTPLLTLWFNTAIIALAERADKKSRKEDELTWFILDDMTDLGVLPELKEAMRNGFQTGHCFVANFETIPAMEAHLNIRPDRLFKVQPALIKMPRKKKVKLEAAINELRDEAMLNTASKTVNAW